MDRIDSMDLMDGMDSRGVIGGRDVTGSREVTGSRDIMGTEIMQDRRNCPRHHSFRPSRPSRPFGPSRPLRTRRPFRLRCPYGFLTLFFATIIPLAGQAQPLMVTVRLFSVTPSSRLRIAPGGNTRFRACATCEWKTLASPLEVAARAGRVVQGTQSAEEIEIQGGYELSVPSAPGRKEALGYPLRVRAVFGHLLATAIMPMEEYVAAVLAGEAATLRSDESLKAMAVAVRTWAAHFRKRHSRLNFDFCDGTHCQVLRPTSVAQRFVAAAAATEGELLWYRGKPAATFYHSSCGGQTEAGAFLDANLRVPYLPSQPDRYCLSRDRHEWQSQISKGDLQHALNEEGIPVSAIKSIAVESRTASGRAATIRLSYRSTGSGADTSATLDAAQFRFAVDRLLGWDRLRSDRYEITDAGDSVLFHGYGQGHGVGLCQAGAARMGEQGSDYRQILAFYYPGATLGLSAQGISWQRLGGERLDVFSTEPSQDQALLREAAFSLRDAEAATGWPMTQRPQLKVFPTVAMFRDSTGEPGWVAASTRAATIRLQPLEILRRAGSLKSTLRHEFLHMLVEQHAGASLSLPLWFREGLVLYLAQDALPLRDTRRRFTASQLEAVFQQPDSREQLQRAYGEAQTRVAALAQKYGRSAVLEWCEKPGQVPSFE